MAFEGSLKDSQRTPYAVGIAGGGPGTGEGWTAFGIKAVAPIPVRFDDPEVSRRSASAASE